MLISELVSSLDDAVGSSDSIPPEILYLLHRMRTVLVDLDAGVTPDTPAFARAAHSLRAELRRFPASLSRSQAPAPASPLDTPVQSLGRSFGLLLMSCVDVPIDVRDTMALHRQMMAYAGGRRDRGRSSSLVDSLDQLLVLIKCGGEDEVGAALLELESSVGGLSEDEEENVINFSIDRLGSIQNHGHRLQLISVLRSLARRRDENKERMSSVGALSTIVKSLSRDSAEERREAVGLLLEVAEVQKVRQRIGRVLDCVVMLVGLLNGEDDGAASDAGKLLGVLSGNTQNVLLMAEAGFFVPLVQYLKEGSDMNKILMATAISRMELSDQMKDALGEEGCIESLVHMFVSGKLEAKMSALGALLNLSSLMKNIRRSIDAGIMSPLLQLLFSVTSSLMTLREPASAILARIAQSETILVQKDVVRQILSLLALSSPTIQFHLLQALNAIASHSNSMNARAKMKETSGLQLLLPFLSDNNGKIKMAALNLLFNLSKDRKGKMIQQLGQPHFNTLVEIIGTSNLMNEQAAAIGILSNIPVVNKEATETLMKANIVPILISLLETSISTSTPTRRGLLESIAGVFIRFTVSWDKKTQKLAASHGIIPCLVKLLKCESSLAKSRAAISLAQLSQNSLALCKIKSTRWFCVHPSSETFCEVHNGSCTEKSTYCLLKAGALPPLVQILGDKEDDAHVAVLNALTTLMQDEIWENGSNAIEKASGVQALVRIVEVGSLEAQAKALWILERVFRLGTHRAMYGESVQVMLVDLVRNGDPFLRPLVSKILVHLQLLQMEPSCSPSPIHES